MNLYHAIYLAGFAAGLLLEVALLATVLARRTAGARLSVPLAAFLAAIALWQAGSLGSMFIGVLLWPGLQEAVQQTAVHKMFVLMSGIGAFLVPPLTVHLFFSLHRKTATRHPRYDAEGRREDGTASGGFRALLGDVMLFVFYLPVAFFALLAVAFFAGEMPLARALGPLFGTERLIEVAGREAPFASRDLQLLIPFGIYLTAACAAAMFFSYDSARRTRRIEEKLFFRAFFRVFLAADAFCALMVVSGAVLAFGFGEAGIETATLRALKLFTMAASFVPGAVLAWFIYRYNIMSLRLKTRPLKLAAATVAIVAYVFTARTVEPHLAGAAGVNPQILEAAFLVAAVALAWPARALARKAARSLVAKRETLYRTHLAKISEQLNSPSIFTLSHLFDFAAENISKMFQTQRVVIALFERDRDGSPLPLIHATNSRKREMKAGTILSFLRNQPSGHIDLATARNPQLLEEMRALRCQVILPLVRGGVVRGFLCLGSPGGQTEYTPTEIELLSLLAGHLVTAAENLILVDDKVQLRRKMLEGEKMLSLGRLSASVAHEVKNPLSSIKTIAQVAREDLDKGSVLYRDLSTIVNEMDRLSAVVERLLRFARPAPEGASDVARMIEDVTEVLRREATRNKVVLRADISPDMPPLRLNAEPLKDILFNLMLNGVQAMPDGGALTVAAQRVEAKADDEAKGALLRITVTDTGPGVAEEIRGRIFEPFFTTKADGTGLGLAIVRERVDELGGSIRIEGGGGAKFIVEIPLTEAQSAVSTGGH